MIPEAETRIRLAADPASEVWEVRGVEAERAPLGPVVAQFMQQVSAIAELEEQLAEIRRLEGIAAPRLEAIEEQCCILLRNAQAPLRLLQRKRQQYEYELWELRCASGLAPELPPPPASTASRAAKPDPLLDATATRLSQLATQRQALQVRQEHTTRALQSLLARYERARILLESTGLIIAGADEPEQR